MITGKWSDKDTQTLRDRFEDTNTKELAKTLNRIPSSIRTKAKEMGLKRGQIGLTCKRCGLIAISPRKLTWFVKSKREGRYKALCIRCQDNPNRRAVKKPVVHIVQKTNIEKAEEMAQQEFGMTLEQLMERNREWMKEDGGYNV